MIHDRRPLGLEIEPGVVDEPVEQLLMVRGGGELGGVLHAGDHRIPPPVGCPSDVLDVDIVHGSDLSQQKLDERLVGELDDELVDGSPSATFQDVDADDLTSGRAHLGSDEAQRTRTGPGARPAG